MANELATNVTPELSQAKPMAAVATAANVAPSVPPKEAARLKRAHVPRKWAHHREDKDGIPVPPGPTWVYFEKGDPKSGVLCNTEEEYIDALNRGARDSFAQEAWE